MGRVLRVMKSGIDTLPASHGVLDPHTLDGLSADQQTRKRPASVTMTGGLGDLAGGMMAFSGGSASATPRFDRISPARAPFPDNSP